MSEELKRFLKDEDGAELVEWAVVTIILLAASVVALTEIGDELYRIFSNILDQLERIPEN